MKKQNKIALKNSLRLRLMSFFLAVSIIPILLLETVSYSIYNRTIMDSAAEFSSEAVDKVAHDMDTELANIENIANVIHHEEIIENVLRQVTEMSPSFRAARAIEANIRLNFIMTYMSDDIEEIIVLAENGEFLRSGYMFLDKGDYSEEAWYKDILEKNGISYIFGLDGLTYQSGDYTKLTLGMPLIDEYTGATFGVLLLNMGSGFLLDKIDGFALGKSGYIFLTDPDNNILLHPSGLSGGDLALFSETLKNSSSQESEIVTAQNRKFMVTKKTLKPGWTVTGVIGVNDLVSDGRNVFITTMLVVLAVSVCALFLSIWFSGHITRPISELAMLMENVTQGDLYVSMDNRYDNEIGQLCESFNYMINKIQDLMETVKNEQKSLRKAELRALQAQINPHFLYNTLDSVIALSEDNETVQNLITALTNFFRLSLSNGQDYISVKNELDHIDNYLKIQKIRYSSRFDYEICYDERLREYRVIKLILQPIVENALMHGILNKREFGFIRINAIEDGADLVFTISDTGKGIDERRLKSINKTLAAGRTAKNDMPGFGIYNVNERLHLFYKDNCRMEYECREGRLTVVTIRVPKTREEHND